MFIALLVVVFLAPICTALALILISANKSGKRTRQSTTVTNWEPTYESTSGDWSNAPEQPMVIRAWRAYAIANDMWKDDQVRLTLKGQREFWNEATMHAECDAMRSPSDFDLKSADTSKMCATHLARNLCECGIYAVKERHDLNQWGHFGNVYVEAECVLWGWVIPGDTGYRAEWCRIDAIHLVGVKSSNEQWAEVYANELCATYGVPVVIDELPAHALWEAKYSTGQIAAGQTVHQHPYFVTGFTIQRAGPSYFRVWSDPLSLEPLVVQQAKALAQLESFQAPEPLMMDPNQMDVFGGEP